MAPKLTDSRNSTKLTWAITNVIVAIVLIVTVSTMVALVALWGKDQPASSSNLSNGAFQTNNSSVVNPATTQEPSKPTISPTLKSSKPSMIPAITHFSKAPTPTADVFILPLKSLPIKPHSSTVKPPAPLYRTAFPNAAPVVTNTPSKARVPTISPTADAQLHTTTFYAHGDIPYNSTQVGILERQMREVPDDAEFVIHVGDLRNASSDRKCVIEEYEEVSALMQLSRAPVFVLIGDNDWTDCPNRDEGLVMWRDHFVDFESRHWNHSFTIQRQEGYPENFAFTHKGSLFIGLNIVGGEIHDANEWGQRLTKEADLDNETYT